MQASISELFVNPKRLYRMDKIAEKEICSECIFDSMALCFECRINKNALLHTAFSAILPTG